MPEMTIRWTARLYLWAAERLYHELAWAYDLASWLVSLGRWSDWRRIALAHITGPRVLEVGFGTGELLLEMAGRDLEVVGLEYSDQMQRIAARKLARRGLAPPRVQGRAQALPFAGGRFDAVISTFPAAYILDLATLGEVARLLRPPDPAGGTEGGRLIVVGLAVTVNSRLWRQAMDLLFGPPPASPLQRWEQLAAGAGLQARIVTWEDRWAQLPVLIAERWVG
jgi:ubiquinone/menaquinone biosynthesis C-methylase UbiE